MEYPHLIGNTSSKGPCPIAMLDYRSENTSKTLQNSLFQLPQPSGWFHPPTIFFLEGGGVDKKNVYIIQDVFLFLYKLQVV